MNIGEPRMKNKDFSNITTTESPNSITLQLKTNDGRGSITVYSVCPGILLSYNKIYAPFWPAPDVDSNSPVLLLNYCISGRCEVALDNGSFAYITDSELCISADNVIKEYSYPSHHYEGIEIFFDLNELNITPDLISELALELGPFYSYYRNSPETYLSEPDPQLKNLLAELWQLGQTERLSTLKLKLLEILSYLEVHTPLPHRKLHVFYSQTQVKIAKAAASILTADLSIRHTAKELADHFNISETSLKNYFRGVYGVNLSSFILQLRIQKAARLLKETQDSITNIAKQVGYENQSKFAAVFKKNYGLAPLEYRRNITLQQRSCCKVTKK